MTGRLVKCSCQWNHILVTWSPHILVSYFGHLFLKYNLEGLRPKSTPLLQYSFFLIIYFCSPALLIFPNVPYTLHSYSEALSLLTLYFSIHTGMPKNSAEQKSEQKNFDYPYNCHMTSNNPYIDSRDYSACFSAQQYFW